MSFLSDMERGRTAPSLETLSKLATCYDVTVSCLLGEEAIDTSDAQELYAEIARRIRVEREALGFSQAELADEIGLSPTSLVNIEAGRQRSPLHVLYAIADALGVSICCLLPKNEPR